MTAFSGALDRRSDEVKDRYREVAWRGIRGFRDIVAHGYVEVLDLELTRRFIEAEVDPLGKLATSEIASWLIIDSAEGAG